jgi:hypothetical protein
VRRKTGGYRRSQSRKTPDIPKQPVLLTVNLAPSVLLPAESEKKTHPCLDDAHPRPYPNEYGRLFFEDKSGNNRMVPSERTGEWAAPPGGDLL